MDGIKDAYLRLMAAIAERAVLDYEILISDKPDTHLDSKVNKEEIRVFTKNTYIDPLLDKIEEVYQKEFRPLIRTHAKDIIREWNSKEVKAMRKHGSSYAQQLGKKWKWKCPLCGGILHPGSRKTGDLDYIVCSHCCLNMRIPEGARKKCTT